VYEPSILINELSQKHQQSYRTLPNRRGQPWDQGREISH
jgi:hypothetical protein